MPEIKFSYDYPKLHNQTNAKLVKVDCLPLLELPQDLLDYDTITETGERYVFPFKNSMVLILTFSGDHFIPFTTIRRSTAQKIMYYKGQIGQIFDIKIMPPKETPKPEAVPETLKL